MKSYLIRLKNAFTVKFLILLIVTQLCLKGIVFVVFVQGIFPLLKDMGIDAIYVQLYGALALSPWTVKPLFGVLSDLIAIGGYHKRYWMLFSSIIGILGAIMMVVEIRIIALIVIFLTMIHFQIAIVDLLCEAQYAELMRKNPSTGSDIVVLANAAQQLGFIIGIGIMGPLADLGLFRVTNSIALALSIVPTIPILIGFLPEVKRARAPVVLVDTLRIRKEWKVIIVVAFTGLSAPAMAAIAAYASKWLGVLCSLVVVTLAILGGFLAYPDNGRLVGRIALFQVLVQASKVSFSSALDFFYTADFDCLPGGPGFDYSFYITLAGIVSAAAFLFTMLIYQLVFSKWKFRSVILLGVIVSGLGGIFDFIIVKRWNILIGIPDSVFFLLADDALHSIVDAILWLPSSSILAKVCPPHIESCTFAYLAGISNFGKMIAVISGALLTELFGISTIETSVGRFLIPHRVASRLIGRNATSTCNWDNLEYLVLFGHVVLMLIVSIPASFLVPNLAQDADFLKKPTPPAPMAELMEGNGDTSDIMLI